MIPGFLSYIIPDNPEKTILFHHYQSHCKNTPKELPFSIIGIFIITFPLWLQMFDYFCRHKELIRIPLKN